MPTTKAPSRICYQFNFVGFMLYYGMLAVMLLLFFGRRHEGLRIPFLVQHDCYSHLSNLVISYIILSTFGLILLLMAAPLKSLYIASAILLVANFIVETVVTFMNVLDILDAVAGTIGIAIAVLTILVLKRYGLKPLVLAKP